MLAAVVSLDGISLAWPRVADCVLKLRLVSRSIMSALESNPSLKINLRITMTGEKNLTASHGLNFLSRWHGNVCLHCTRPWNPCNRWLTAVSDALLSGRLRPLSLLSLSVEGKNLPPLVESLAELGPAVQQLEITYCGDVAELLAAATNIASLGQALTMKISVKESDPVGRQTCMWLQHMLASGIGISSISFR